MAMRTMFNRDLLKRIHHQHVRKRVQIVIILLELFVNDHCDQVNADSNKRLRITSYQIGLELRSKV